MSEIWAKRQRRTNKLVRSIADFLFAQQTVFPNQIYGLCKLTWITESFSGVNAKYIQSTKIPALADIFDPNFLNKNLNEVAIEVSIRLESPFVKKLVLNHTGFTNFYKAYRNSAKNWIADNFSLILPLFEAAYKLKTDEQGFELIQKIENLPKLPNNNSRKGLMEAKNLLTPAFFALDKRIRFPLINGNDNVKKLLTNLEVAHGSLAEQYQSMIRLYEKDDIDDAADLDQLGKEITDKIFSESLTKEFMKEQPVKGNELPLKDETDLESLLEARTVRKKQIHNTLTNKLRRSLSSGYRLKEGSNNAALFDALVENYNGNGDNLFIEAKSSTDAANIKMAIGQLYAYWYCTYKQKNPHLAILLPNKPKNRELIGLLDWLEIGILWFTGDELKTCNPWLEHLVDDR